MSKPVIKLEIPGDRYKLYIFESEPGKLTFEMLTSDDEQYYGGEVTIDVDEFKGLLKRLLGEG